ncbi:MAG TPA: AraC family transcriptional regulator [Burkholderiales bacterium]|nr:AraC family transcriptional regulator [Burkholderiales bacterium]
MRAAKRAYGRELSDAFGLAAARSFQSRSLPHSAAAVTEILCDTENNGLTRPLAREDACLVTMQLRDCPEHELWLDGKPMRTGHLRAGTLCLYDLRTNPQVNSISAFHNMHFYFPRAVLEAAAEGSDVADLDFSPHNPGEGVHDATVHALARSLLPAFESPAQAAQVFLDHVTIAVAAYVVRRFGRVRAGYVSSRLASWQQRHVREMLCAHLAGDVSIEALARECRLPVTVFLAAFRGTTGMSPHRWLSLERAEHARRLLKAGLQIAHVAHRCGFASVDRLLQALRKPIEVVPPLQ